MTGSIDSLSKGELLTVLSLIVYDVKHAMVKITGYNYILNETSKPPLNIFSYILKYMIHTWLRFTLNMEKSIKENLSKFHFHKSKITCSVDRLYKGTIAFHFHTNARV